MKFHLFKEKFLKDQSGVALLMVMSSIALLAFLLADFTFETKINQLKAYNAQDRAQARLNAEAGIHFSLAKLRIYQEVRNKIEKNESLKSFVKPQALEQVLVQPFVLPIPVMPKASLIQKNAIKEFEEGTVLKGDLSITMTQISGFLNPNNLRIPVPDPSTQTNNQNQDGNQNQGQNGNQNDPPKSPLQITEEKITEMLREEIRKQREESNLFDQLYPNLTAEYLVKELKYYVNNPNAVQDPEIIDIQRLYEQEGLYAKHAPMSSLEEFYALAGWPEMLINLVKDRFTVHEVGFISLNDLTEDTLRLLFPNITPEQSEEFFRYRDGDPQLGEDPKPFQAVDDFKNLVVNRLAIVSSSDFTKREKEFEAANLRFGVAGKLYRVISTGKYNTATVKLTAYIDLPVKPQPKPQTPNNPNNPNVPNNPNDPDDPNDPNDPDNPNNNQSQAGQNPNEPPKFKVDLMLPRIVELKME